MYVRILWVVGDGNQTHTSLSKGELESTTGGRLGTLGTGEKKAQNMAQVFTLLSGSVSSFVGIIHIYTADWPLQKHIGSHGFRRLHHPE